MLQRVKIKEMRKFQRKKLKIKLKWWMNDLKKSNDFKYFWGIELDILISTWRKNENES
jgi:hypothetical protein